MNAPLAYLWIVVLAVFLWKRNAWTGLALAAFTWALILWWVAAYDLVNGLYLGRQGGCVGSLNVMLAVLIPVSLLGLLVVIVRFYRWMSTRGSFLE